MRSKTSSQKNHAPQETPLPRLTEVRRLDIRTRLAQATRGPWEAVRHEVEHELNRVFAVDPDDEIEIYPPEELIGPVAIAASKEDGAFIAHAREDVAVLLAEVEALHRERDTAQMALDHLRALIEECPLGWHVGTVMIHRNITQEQVVTWLQQLHQVAHTAETCLDLSPGGEK